jgi:hypothetical protein
MNEERLEALRNYYDSTDLTSELEKAEIDAEIEQSPMVGITVRFPTDVLQQVRTAAAALGVKPTALIRTWVEQQLSTRGTPGSHQALRFNQVLAGKTLLSGGGSHFAEFHSVRVSRFEEHTEPAESEAFRRRSAELAVARG